MTLKFAAALGAAAAVAFVAGSGAATASSCDALQLSGDASGFSLVGDFKRCELGSTQNDFLGGGTLQVNADRLFGAGPSDWAFLTKWDLSANGAAVSEDAGLPGGGFYSDGIVVTDAKGAGLGGTFHISDEVRALTGEIMVVIKGTGQDLYAAFLLNELVGSSGEGRYASIFENAKGKLQNISHLSFYGRTGTPASPSSSGAQSLLASDVPVPGALPLLAGALAMLGLARGRRRA